MKERDSMDEGFLDKLEEVQDDRDNRDEGEGEDAGPPDKRDRRIDTGTGTDDAGRGGGDTDRGQEAEGTVSLGEWDPDDLESTIRKFHEVSSVFKDISKIKEKLEDALVFALKKRRWDKAVTEDAKVTVRLAAKKKQIIDRDTLIKTLTKSQIEKLIRIVETEYIEISDDSVRERLKKHAI